jgi:hypothetical protein
MEETTLAMRASQASPEDIRRFQTREHNRRQDARHRLLAAILEAAESNENCNTLWDDEVIPKIKQDIRTTISEWMVELNKEAKL